jgi:regulator of replication initiation timing
MNTFLFVLAITLLTETIFSKILAKFNTDISIFKKIHEFIEKHKLATVSLSIILLITSFTLTQMEKKKEEFKMLSRENKMLNLEINSKKLEMKSIELELKSKKIEKQNAEYKNKLNEANGIIKNIAIIFSVGFEVPSIIFSDNSILGTGIVYALIGNNVALKSNGVTFRFIPEGMNRFNMELNAGLMDGDFPVGDKIEMFKDYKEISIYLPFLKNGGVMNQFIVHNYTISLTINGIRVSPIVNFDKKFYRY